MMMEMIQRGTLVMTLVNKYISGSRTKVEVPSGTIGMVLGRPTEASYKKWAVGMLVGGRQYVRRYLPAEIEVKG